MDEGYGFTLWRVGEEMWDNWAKLEEDMPWLTFKGDVVYIEGCRKVTSDHWRWHVGAVCFRYEFWSLCRVVHAFPCASVVNCGWWWYARLYEPEGEDAGVRA